MSQTLNHADRKVSGPMLVTFAKKSVHEHERQVRKHHSITGIVTAVVGAAITTGGVLAGFAGTELVAIPVWIGAVTTMSGAYLTYRGYADKKALEHSQARLANITKRYPEVS